MQVSMHLMPSASALSLRNWWTWELWDIKIAKELLVLGSREGSISFPLLKAFLSCRALVSTFLVWKSPWKGCVPVSACNPVHHFCSFSLWLLTWFVVFPFYFHSFTYFLLQLPLHPLLVPFYSPSSFPYRPASSYSYHCHAFFLTTSFPHHPSLLPPQIHVMAKTQEKIKLLGSIRAGRN